MNETSHVASSEDLEHLEEVVRNVMSRTVIKFVTTVGIFLALWTGSGLWWMSAMDTRVETIEGTRNTHTEGRIRDERITHLSNRTDDIKELLREVIVRQRAVETSLGTIKQQLSALQPATRAGGYEP